MYEEDDKENWCTSAFKKPNVSNENASGDKAITTTNQSAAKQHEEALMEQNSDAPSQWQRSSDESFEAIEKMCDKTASDPNSTLFKYIHSDCKDVVIECAKKRSRSAEIKEYDRESHDLKCLLDQLRLEEQINLENESPLKGVDVTALEDVEAPSRLWENTITNETILQTSPVKMVGLLRPSTIIEDYDGEGGSIVSDISSHLSFKSASKGALPNEYSTSCYETANESSATSKSSSNIGGNTGKAIEKKDEHTENPLKDLPQIKVTEPTLNASSIEGTFGEFAEKLDQLDKSATDIVDLENKSSASVQNSPEPDANANEQSKVDEEILANQSNASDSEESVIEIESDDDSDGSGVEKSPQIKNENVSNAASNSYTSSVNRTSEESHDKSMIFNDTMEEVEYMMKKGLQYLAASNCAANSPAPLQRNDRKLTPLKVKHNIAISPKSAGRYRAPSPLSYKHRPIATPFGASPTSTNIMPKSSKIAIAKPKPIHPFALEMKPFPKLELFKTPASKQANSKQFSHIISPVRAYIKNSSYTPLMHTINDVNKNPKSFTSMRELENESRLYKPNFDSAGTGLSMSPSIPRSLPKKAYISSEVKQIFDKRTPVTIPGGKQYQKHIESALLPAVLKHEGKAKIENLLGDGSGGNSNSGAIPKTQRRNDVSVGDLSVMSGDVSVYTIKDARKF